MIKVLKSIFLLSLFFISISGIQAQTLSKEEVQRAVDYLNCKSVLLANQQSATSGVTAEFEKNCNCESNITFDKIKGAIASSEDKTLELSKEINSIVNQKDISSKTKDELILLLTEGIFNDSSKYKVIYEFAHKPGRESNIEALKSDLKKKFDEPDFFSNANKPSKESEEITSNATKNEQTAESGWFSGFSSQMIVISLLLSFIISLFFFLIILSQLKNQKKQLVSEMEKRKVPQNNNHVKNDKGTNDEYTKLQKQLEAVFNEKIVQLQSELKYLKNEIDELKNKLQTPKLEIKETKTTLEPKKFYLSNPLGEGILDNDSKHTTMRAGESIFEAIEIGTNRAEFNVCNNNSSMNRALSNSVRYIKPVCEELNEQGNAPRIHTVAPGVIELQGNKWIVITKAKIRYEI